MTRKDRMRKQYDRHSAADGYAIGFVKDDKVCVTMLDKIPPRFMLVKREAGGKDYGLYVNFTTKKAQKYLENKGYEVIGTTEDFNQPYNRGVVVEKLLHERNGETWEGPDTVGFWKRGDVTIDGKEIQVKFGFARMARNKTLQRLEGRA